MEERYYRSDFFTLTDRKTGAITKRIEIKYYLRPDWSYRMEFIQLV